MDRKNLKIVIAPDSFKESLTSTEICNAIEEGILKGNPLANCIKIPMADGGEGTTKALIDAIGGEIYNAVVTGPMGSMVDASYGISSDGQIGILEMASASGIDLVSYENRNPMVTTTYGTGEVIREILDKGVKKIIIGIGGSATNDCGSGMLQALGVSIKDSNLNEIGFGGGELHKAVTIDISNMDKRLNQVEILVACDVDNPLTGQKGASFVYGPQKGASSDQIIFLDNSLQKFSNIIENTVKKKVDDIPGAGAAGGLGAALYAFLNGKLMKGIDIVIEAVELEKNIRVADLVITGEGRVDSSTLYGKTVSGITSIAKKYDKPVVVLAGAIGDHGDRLYDIGVTTVFSILKQPCTLQDAYIEAYSNLVYTSENLARLINGI